MGCDIHMIVEVKRNESWTGIEELPESLNERNYSIFVFFGKCQKFF